MKNVFSKKYFFDLEKFSYKELWVEDFAWSPFHYLTSFFQSQKLGKIKSNIPDNVFFEDLSQVSVGKGVTFEPYCYVKGPCIIEDGVEVKSHAYIGANVIVGKNSKIGHASEVKNSILLSSSSIPHFNYVGDSIVGNRVNLGAGVKCANLRLDGKCIDISFEGNIIKTGFKKFGAIIGDGARIGCNTTVNPATFIGPHSIIYPNLIVRGFIPEKAILKKL